MQIRSLFRGASANGVDVSELLRRAEGRVHLGCNDVRLEGFVNVDLRATKATDLVHDCKDLSVFAPKSLRFVYSNAFLEHVFLADQQRLMQDVLRVLCEDGWVAFTGLPDFEGIARAYLERRSPGNVSGVFDLREAYRYTHGAPEGKPDWWLAQLHKVLLDAPTLLELCKTSGFGSCEVFSYCWGDEPNQTTLGFTATRGASRRSITDASVKAQLAKLPANINWNTAAVKGAF